MVASISHRAILAGLTAALAAVGVASARDLPSSFVPRCQVDALRAYPGAADPCSEEFAVLGLRGPTVIAGTAPLDIETTGSVSAREAETGDPPSSDGVQ